MTTKKDWVKKLKEAKNLPKVEKLTGKAAQKWGRGTIAIPHPMEVDELMRKVPKGKLITVNEMRGAVARRHKATVGCPLTCGIFINIVARAAEQERGEGKKNITPWWRTLKSGGVLNEKYPGGIESQRKLLLKEDHKVIQKGKKIVVSGFEKVLAEI